MNKYGKWIKFQDLSKKDKIFRVINFVLMIAMLITTIALLIYYVKTGDVHNRLVTCISMSLLYILPFLIEIIMRRRIQNLFVFCYLIYALVAGLIGSVLYMYYRVSWFDIVVHTFAGYIFSFAGIFILSRTENYSKLKPITVLMFCLFCTLAIELVWEMSEWFGDLFLGQTAQGEPVPGYKVPFVTDTDLDMLCNLIGGIIFSIQFAIGKYTKYSLGINYIESELCPKKKDENEELVNSNEIIDKENSIDEKESEIN